MHGETVLELSEDLVAEGRMREVRRKAQLAARRSLDAMGYQWPDSAQLLLRSWAFRPGIVGKFRAHECSRNAHERVSTGRHGTSPRSLSETRIRLTMHFAVLAVTTGKEPAVLAEPALGLGLRPICARDANARPTFPADGGRRASRTLHGDSQHGHAFTSQ